MDEYNTQSDWHQQVSFADLYFKISLGCRELQFQRRHVDWGNALLTKISLVNGILKDTKDDQEISNQLDKLVGEIRSMMAKLNSPHNQNEKSRVATDLYTLLYKSEAAIDRITNTRMPFLAVKKKFDIEGL